jgi:hypothetical protein
MCTFVRRKEEKDSNLALAFYSYLLAEADMAGDAVVLRRGHLDLGDDGQRRATGTRGQKARG